MQENAPGGFGNLYQVSLEEIAHESATAERIDMIRKMRTNRRNGNKGSRKWGFMEPSRKKNRS